MIPVLKIEIIKNIILKYGVFCIILKIFEKNNIIFNKIVFTIVRKNNIFAGF